MDFTAGILANPPRRMTRHETRRDRASSCLARPAAPRSVGSRRPIRPSRAERRRRRRRGGDRRASRHRDPAQGRQRDRRRRGRRARARGHVAGGRQHRRRRLLDLPRRAGRASVDRFPRGRSARRPARHVLAPGARGTRRRRRKDRSRRACPGPSPASPLAHRRGGRLPWKAVVEPAVRLARDGFVDDGEHRATSIAAEQERLAGDPETARIFLPGGEPPRAGLVLPATRPRANAEAIRDRGEDGFYRGRRRARDRGGPEARRGV